MPQKSIRDNCLADYAKTLPEKEGKALLARFDAVTGRNISEYQAARDIIIDEHKKLFARLNDIKVKAGEKVAEYQEPSEPDYAGIDNAVKEILTKKTGEVKQKSDARKEEIEKRRVQIENERKARQEEKAKKEAEAAEKKRLIEEKKNEKDEKLAEKKKKIKEIQDSLNVSEKAAVNILNVPAKFKSLEMQKAEISRIVRNDRAAAKLRNSDKLHDGGTQEVKAEQPTVSETGTKSKGSGVGGDALKDVESTAKIQNYTQFAAENGYPDDYDTAFQAQLLGGRGLEGKRQSNRSIKEQDDAFNKMQNKKAEGKKAYEQAILEGKVIDPDGKLTKEGILKRDYDFAKKEFESKIKNAESGIKNIEGLGKMSHLDNGKLKKGYQRAVDDYNEKISKYKEELSKLKSEYERLIESLLSKEQTTQEVKAEQPTVLGKEEGSGGNVESKAKEIVGESAFNKLKKEGYTVEKGKFDSDAYASFFGLHTGVQAAEFEKAGLRLVKPSEKIKVYRGKGKNVAEGENEGITWVAEDKKVAENYSGDGQVEEIEISKPKNPFPNPTDTIYVKGSDVGNKLRLVRDRLFKEGKLTKEQALKASKAIDEFVSAAGEESELYSTKTNKKGVASKYVKALQALGFDGIVQKESYNSGSPFTATKTGNETNTYGIFKEQSTQEAKAEQPTVLGKEVGSVGGEKLVEDKDTLLVDGIKNVSKNKQASDLLKIAMNRGVIPERQYNNFGKELASLKVTPKSKTAVVDVAELIQKYSDAKNEKTDEVIKAANQAIENADFEKRAYADMTPQEKFEAVIEDKAATSEKLTPEELKFVNENYFAPKGYRYNENFELVKSKKSLPTQEVKAEQPTAAKLRNSDKLHDGGTINGEYNEFGESGPFADLQLTDELIEKINDIPGFEIILKNTMDLQAQFIGDNPIRSELANSAKKTVGAAKQFISDKNVTVEEGVAEALKDGDMAVTNDTTLFDIILSDEASEQQKGAAISYIIADRMMQREDYLSELFRKAGAGIVLRFNQNLSSRLSAIDKDGGKIVINAANLGKRLYEIGGESKFFTWAEAALYEEAIHLATFKVSNFDEIDGIGRELSDSERMMVQSVYGSELTRVNDKGKREPDYYYIGLEYVRQIIQKSLIGTTTEMTKPAGGTHRMRFFAKMIKFLRDLFSVKKPDSIANRVVSRLEVFTGLKKAETSAKTIEGMIADKPKIRQYESTSDGRPVFMFQYKNRQYFFMQADWMQSGKAWFEVEKSQWGEWLPVGMLTNVGEEVPGLIGFTYPEATSNLMARGGRGYGESNENGNDNIDRIVEKYMDSELFKELAKQYSGDAIVQGDPIRKFEFPLGDDVMQDSMLTQLKRDEKYEAEVDEWVRPSINLIATKIKMTAIVDDIFAKNNFDTALEYIIDVLYDKSLDSVNPGVRGALVNVVIDKIKYTHPAQAAMIREKILAGPGGIAQTASLQLGVLRDQDTSSSKEKGAAEARIEVREFFRDATEKNAKEILSAVQDGDRISKAIQDVQEANARARLNKNEMELLAAMADYTQEELSEATAAAQKVVSDIKKAEKKIAKIGNEEKKLAKARAGNTSYKMLARRQAKTMEEVFSSIKRTLSDVIKNC